MDLAKLIRHFRNSLSAIRAEAVQLDECSVPGFNILSDGFDRIVDVFHLVILSRKQIVQLVSGNLDRQKPSA